VLNHGTRSVVLKGPAPPPPFTPAAKVEPWKSIFTAEDHGTEKIVVAGLGAADEAAARAGKPAGPASPLKEVDVLPNMAAGIETGVEAVAMSGWLVVRRPVSSPSSVTAIASPREVHLRIDVLHAC
jgi:hypothetical protein